MYQIHKFISFTLDLVLTYILQIQINNFPKRSLLFGIKVFNHLPTSIKNTSHDINQFSLKSFLLTNSFYLL